MFIMIHTELNVTERKSFQEDHDLTSCNWFRLVSLRPLQSSGDWSKKLSSSQNHHLPFPFQLLFVSLISTIKPGAPSELCWFSSSQFFQITSHSSVHDRLHFSALQLQHSMEHKGWGLQSAKELCLCSNKVGTGDWTRVSSASYPVHAETISQPLTTPRMNGISLRFHCLLFIHKKMKKKRKKEQQARPMVFNRS